MFINLNIIFQNFTENLNLLIFVFSRFKIVIHSFNEHINKIKIQNTKSNKIITFSNLQLYIFTFYV